MNDHYIESAFGNPFPQRQVARLDDEGAGLVGSDAENLRDAIKGESYEIDIMYLEFAGQATTAGDTAAAARFEEVRHDEMSHRDAFKSALTELGTKAGG